MPRPIANDSHPLLSHRLNLLARRAQSIVLLSAGEKAVVPMNAGDPIIAAIEAHRRACAETRAAYERQSAVENELGAGVMLPAGEAENDPRWIAANDAAATALAVQDELAAKLLEISPTTIVGAAALLTYYVDVIATPQAEEVFPNLDVIGWQLDSTSIDEPTRDFGYLMVRNVHTALSLWLTRQ